MLIYPGHSFEPRRFDPKDPADVDAFQWDWSGQLVAGETIAAHVVTVDDPGLVKDSDSVIGGSIVSATLSLGIAGKEHRVRCTVTTSDSRVLEVTGIVPIRNR